MADSELGELRRPPRLLEHRIERLTRHRSGGLAGGTSDALIPVDSTDDVLAGSSGAGSAIEDAIPEWYRDSTTLTASSPTTWALTFHPIEHSEVVRLNGMVLDRGVDYSIAGNVVTFLDLAGLRLGIGAGSWTLSANYAYTDVAEPTFEAPDFLTWTLNGAASLVGSTVRLHTSAGSTDGSMVCPTAVPAGWVEIDVTVTMNVLADGDGWQAILWDAATHAATELGIAGTRFSGVINDSWPGTNATVFTANDGTTTTSDADGAAFGSGWPTDRDFRFVWTKTGASTAHVSVYRDGALVKSSPADVWVPATALIGIYGRNGLLSSNVKIVKGVAVTVGA